MTRCSTGMVGWGKTKENWNSSPLAFWIRRPFGFDPQEARQFYLRSLQSFSIHLITESLRRFPSPSLAGMDRVGEQLAVVGDLGSSSRLWELLLGSVSIRGFSFTRAQLQPKWLVRNRWDHSIHDNSLCLKFENKIFHHSENLQESIVCNSKDKNERGWQPWQKPHLLVARAGQDSSVSCNPYASINKSKIYATMVMESPRVLSTSAQTTHFSTFRHCPASSSSMSSAGSRIIIKLQCSKSEERLNNKIIWSIMKGFRTMCKHQLHFLS